MKICLRTHMVSDDPAVRIDYCRQVGVGAVQESAKSIPSAVERGWPTAKGLWGAREYDSLFDAVPDRENGMIFCFGCMAMSGYDVREVTARYVDRICFVHVRDVVIHPTGQVDEVFPGTGQVRPDTAIKLLHKLGYRGALAPEHLPKVFGERRNEISMAWAAGYCRAALADLAD